MDQEPQGLGVVRVEAQSLRDGNGDLHANLAMIFQMAFAQVVQQAAPRCKRYFCRNGPIDASQRTGIGPEIGGKLDRPQTMFVHGVFVIQIELQQAPGAGEFGNESFQKAGIVQIVKQRAEPGGMIEQGKKMPAGLGRRHGLGQVDRFAADDFPRFRRRWACRKDWPNRPGG